MMKRKVIVYIAMSLDGFIATESDSLEWLFKVEGQGDNGYSEFYETVDTVVLGRRTYDWLIEAEGDNFPYKNKSCYVFSNTLKGGDDNVIFTNENIVSFVNKLREQEGQAIWIVGGGSLLSELIKENMIDEYIINIAPTLIGSGIPLFQSDEKNVTLELVGIKRWNQFAEVHYKKIEE